MPSVPSSVAGSWAGSFSSDGASAPIRFDIVDQGGTLTGTQIVFDPSTGAAIRVGNLSGARQGGSANWTTMSGLAVTGSFHGTDFDGVAAFGGTLGIPAQSLVIHLSKATTSP